MGIGFRELLVILAIALLVFGAKKLKTIGSDLGGAVKGFKKAMNEGDEEEEKKSAEEMKKLRSDAPDAEFAEKTTPAEKKDRQA
jgi:sec-independent protein translocase protein TatA